MAGGGALGRALESMKEQLRALPDNGLGYGVLRYLKQTAAHLEGFASLISTSWPGRFHSETILDTL